MIVIMTNMNIIKLIKLNETIKFIQKTHDNYEIETVYVDYKDKHIICFSSQIGCPIKCIFCNSSNKKFIRNLSENELIKQCENILNFMDSSNKNILLSCMGEGEPFLNYKNILNCFYNFKHKKYRFSISTSGIRPDLIANLSNENILLKLQISLHAPNDDIRKKLIPNTKCISDIFKNIKYFDKNMVELNYVLIEDVNDSEILANELSKFNYKIKLNKFNKNSTEFLPSQKSNKFMDVLSKNKIDFEYYRTNGCEINASCGQLNYKEN